MRRLNTINAVYQWINQTCGAIKEIKIIKKEEKILDNFSAKVKKFEQSKKITEIISALPLALFELIFVILILLLIKFLVQEDSISSLPTLSLYVVAFVRLLPIARFGTNISMLDFLSLSNLLNQELIGKHSIQNEIPQK